MRPLGHESIVVNLRRCPAVQEAIETAQTNCSRHYSRNSDLWRTNGTWRNLETLVGGNGVTGNRQIDIPADATESHPHGIDQRRGENVRLFHGGCLAARKNLMDGVLQRIGLRLWPRIEKVADRQVILIRKFLVHSPGGVIFIRNSWQSYPELHRVRIRCTLANGRAGP